MPTEIIIRQFVVKNIKNMSGIEFENKMVMSRVLKEYGINDTTEKV